MQEVPSSSRAHPRVEFLLCGSPNDAFYSQIALFRMSLDGFGPRGRAARVVAAFGGEEYPPLPPRWRPHFERIEVHRASPADYRQKGVFAANDLRFELVDDQAEISCLCDADTVLVRPLPESFFAELERNPAISGVVAHYPFPIQRDSRGGVDAAGLFPGMAPELAWDRLGEIFLGRPPARPLAHTLLEDTADGRCPFYPNYGFVAGPPRLLRQLYRCMAEMQPALQEMLGNDFSGQVAIALAVEKAAIPWRALPMRFNFPNDRDADRLHPGELREIVLLHYLRDTAFDRHRIFADPRAFEHFLWQPLVGSDRVLQDHVLALTGGRYFGALRARPGSSADVAEPRSLGARDNNRREPLRESGRQLVICGMHRSGTSLTASVLLHAGLHLGDDLDPGDRGNPRGHFEDPAFRDLHDDALAASGYTCFTAEESLHPSADSTFDRRARDLVAARAGRALWGWKDPRTSLFLDFWDELLPAASYLFLYRHPVDVALSLARRDSNPEIARDPWVAVRGWEVYNGCVLAFLERFPQRCFLAEVPALTADLGGFVRQVAQKLDLPLTDQGAAAPFFPAELAIRAPRLNAAWEVVIPEALALYRRLAACADIAGATPVDHGDHSVLVPAAPEPRRHGLQVAGETLLLTVLESRALGGGPMARKLGLDAARLREQDALLAAGESALREERGSRLAVASALEEERRRVVELTSTVERLAEAQRRSAAGQQELVWHEQQALAAQREATAELSQLGARCDELAAALQAIESSRAFACVRVWWRFRRGLAAAVQGGRRAEGSAAATAVTVGDRGEGASRVPRPTGSFDLIIVCGGRRSGTTLLNAVLCSDAQANPLGQEAQILTRAVEAYRWGRLHFDDFGRSFFRDRERYRELFGEATALLLARVAEEISPGRALVLKNPELSLVLVDLAELLPAATFLATVRDPRDQVASELEVGARRVAAGIADPVSESRDVASLASAYVAYYAEILALRQRSPERVHIVRYEDLVQQPAETLEPLRAVTGLALPFDAAQPWGRVSPLSALHVGPSQSDLYGGPLDQRSIGRFRRDLVREEIAVVEAHAAELMREFDYEAEAR